jgi:hypothetical protein
MSTTICRIPVLASVAGLPPAWIGVGALDLFVEEDMEYARRLVHAGVATELLVVPGAFHGFDLLVPDAGASKRFSARWKTALRKASPLAKLFSREAGSVAAECGAVKEIFLDGLSNSGAVVRRPSEGIGNPPALKAMKGRLRPPPYSRSSAA